MTNYAINYALGAHEYVLIVPAADADSAYDASRSELRRLRLVSAALQGSCRVATQSDIERAWPECSICRSRHGREIEHACE